MLQIPNTNSVLRPASVGADLEWPDHARMTERSAGLDAILADAVNLAIWNRGDAPVVDMRQLDLVEDVAIVVRVGSVATIPDALVAAGYGSASARSLGGDIADLARHFAALLEIDRVAIRLEVVETDACRRFHADYVAVRLICSYAGPGTQWLSNDVAEALAGGVDVSALPIRSIATGDVALFKGRDRSDAPIVHRSPPIAGSALRRLVLVIDPARPDQPAATRSAATGAKPAR